MIENDSKEVLLRMFEHLIEKEHTKKQASDMGSGQSQNLDGLAFLDTGSVGCKGKRESKVDAKLLRLM